ncbi:TetR/AcrR family transcriptional regulator [Nocardioides sp. SYSU D00038]|uniref:TetR/AcrR family transcriptional regulator n=1 Tax=Nocardioides sp. SYSU D00038 TaxID=2812554 RepID=UPI0019687858|nr:TetR family transcriptional regulator C-terminal domain-containing protein [Nocardioides sp. SYSU D00038]
MPRLIDHSERRQELARATWRLILREGVSAVSVRTVAAEAGVSAGSLRHVLPTKAELLGSAMELAIERATARFLDHERRVGSVPGAVRWLSELLPLDDERRAELSIQLALVAEAGGHPRLRELREAAYDGVGTACLSVLTFLAEAGLVDPSRSLPAEAVRLQVLLDGLALGLIHRGGVSPTRARRLLTDHLASLAAG